MHSKWFDARCTVVPPPEWELQSVREMETLEVQLLPKKCCWQGIASNPQPAGTCDHSDTSQPRPAFAGFVPSVRCGCWVASARAVLQPTNLLAGLNNTRMSFWEGQSGQRTVWKKGCFGNPVWLSSVFRFPEFYISGNLGYQYPEISKHPWAYRRSGDKNGSKWELQQCLVKAPITISPLP